MKDRDKVRALRARTHLAASLPTCAAVLDETKGDLQQAKALLMDRGHFGSQRAAFGRVVDPDAPAGWGYILAKADLYLRLGPARYREADAFGMPSADWDDDVLAGIASCFRQFADGKGYRGDNPLIGVGIEAFYGVVTTLHFELVQQSATASSDGRAFIDAMLLEHVVDGRRITLFNAVPRDPGG